jgi:hypothetical protein
MLAYYPLEHLYYLASHGIIGTSIANPLALFKQKRIQLDVNALGIWSTRFWALYVLLQFAHLREERALLQQKERTLRKAKGTTPNAGEKQELAKRWQGLWNEVAVNLANLPLTVHWFVFFTVTFAASNNIVGPWRTVFSKMRQVE